ncbi:MAG TPA: transketolase C-terminal domain-containing protein, partial [bacterium]|nr:transketolase C-terminal domain-containing protein [bacterium]
VFDTPLSENGITGVAVGSALAGRRPVLVHQRVDFMLLTMDQLVNHAAAWRRMFGGRLTVPLTIRAIIGRGWGSAAQHSQNLQALFSHVPGLKVVMPATAYDAKGLLLAAIADPDPVVFLEHRWLYDTVDEVPAGAYLVPLGKAVVRRPGRSVTVAAISHMAGEAEKAARLLAERGIEVEIIDLRTLRPLDLETVLASVEKTGRLVVADTGWRTGGVAAEVVAAVTERGFGLLRRAPVRVACPDLPTPAGPELEKAYYPGAAEILRAVEGLR